MDGFETIKEMLPFLIPLALLQIALMVIALVDLVRRKRVKGDSKILWAVLIVFINIIGPIVYLLLGREEE